MPLAKSRAWGWPAPLFNAAQSRTESLDRTAGHACARNTRANPENVTAVVPPRLFIDLRRCVQSYLINSHKMTWHIVHTYLPELVPQGTFQALCVYASFAVGVGALLYFTIERTFLRLREPNPRALPLGPINVAAKQI